MRTLYGVAILFGLGGGVAVGLSLPAPPPDRVVVEHAPAPVELEAGRREAPSGDCSTAVTSLVEARESLKRRVKTARLVRQTQIVRREQREGIAQPWPADVDPALRPAVFEAAVREAAAETGFTVLAVDCAEYPCLVRAEKTEDLLETEGSSAEDAMVLVEALGPDYDSLRTGSVISFLDTKRMRYVTTFALTDRELDEIEGASRRVEWRSDELGGAHP